MIQYSHDSKTMTVTLEKFSIDDLVVTQKAIINLVKNYTAEPEDGNVFYALNLLEELLPDEQQLKRALTPDQIYFSPVKRAD